MTWTKSKLARIPEVYRDFMQTLGPIIDSRDRVIKTSAVHLGSIFTALSRVYPYSPEDVREIATRLEQRGLILIDEMGFVRLTDDGESLVDAVRGRQTVAHAIPDLPEF